MIIGDLNLDWAEQDPDYLARVKAFLVDDVPSAAESAAWPTDAAIPAGAVTTDDNASGLALD